MSEEGNQKVMPSKELFLPTTKYTDCVLLTPQAHSPLVLEPGFALGSSPVYCTLPSCLPISAPSGDKPVAVNVLIGQ